LAGLFKKNGFCLGVDEITVIFAEELVNQENVAQFLVSSFALFRFRFFV
jgi:hypothetical protein